MIDRPADIDQIRIAVYLRFKAQGADACHMKCIFQRISFACGFVAALICLCIYNGLAQDMNFDHLTIEEGLSHNTVYSITKDADGFMWFGTRDGLNRYDGYQFKAYKSGGPDSIDLSGNNVQSLFTQKNGDLWIGLAMGGLCVLERATQSITSNPFDGLIDLDWNTLSVLAIFRDSFGSTWLGTNNGVLKIDSTLTTLDHFSTGSLVPGRLMEANECFAIVEDSDHDIWMGTSGGAIHKYDRADDAVVTVRPEDDQGSIFSYRKALLFHNDHIWVGTEGAGLWIYSPQQDMFVGSFLSNALIRDVAVQANGNVLISVDGEGLYVYSGIGNMLNHFQYTSTVTNSLNTNALYDIFVDDQEFVWIGTFNGGVNVFKPGKAHFHTYLQTNDPFQIPGSQSVLAFCEMADSTVWVGMDGGGLWKFDIEDQSYTRFEQVYPELDVKTDVVTALFEDSKDYFWIGTYAQGLYRLNPRTNALRHYTEDITNPRVLQNNNIWDMAEDQSGDLWIATLGGGLHRYNYADDEFTNWVPQPNDVESLSQRNVQAILIDDENNVWVGTEHGGLNLLTATKDKFKKWQKHQNDSTSLQSNTVLCLHQDARGRIWVGTEGGGLHMIKNDHSGFVCYSQEDGLPSNVVNAIEEASDGTLWISTNQGLATFNHDSGSFTRYDKNDGLASNQFNPNASIKLQSGKMLFGNIRGLNGFDPKTIDRRMEFPKVVFTDFKVFNTSVPVGQFDGRVILPLPLNEEPTIRLGRHENAFTIEFAALDYTNPFKTSYAYTMEGFQDSWTMVDPLKRSATFTNLGPGTYTFRVRASNHIGGWSDRSSILYFKRIPTFWETIWFKVSVIIGLLAPVVIYVRYLNWKRKEEHEKEVALAHQEILELKNIQLTTEVDRKNSQLSAALLQSAHKNKALEGLKKQLTEISGHLKPNISERRELRHVVNKIDVEVTSKSYWEQFQLNFDQVHQDFAIKLKDRFPDLTPNEIRLCCLIRINLANREVASIQNISIAGVEKAKYRLKRKLGLNPEQDLTQYVLNFS